MGGLSACGLQKLRHMRSVAEARELQSMGSVVVVHRLSCSHGMWDIPGPGIKPVSPGLAGDF